MGYYHHSFYWPERSCLYSLLADPRNAVKKISLLYSHQLGCKKDGQLTRIDRLGATQSGPGTICFFQLLVLSVSLMTASGQDLFSQPLSWGEVGGLCRHAQKVNIDGKPGKKRQVHPFLTLQTEHELWYTLSNREPVPAFLGYFNTHA